MIHYLNINQKFLTPTGVLSKDIMGTSGNPIP